MSGLRSSRNLLEAPMVIRIVLAVWKLLQITNRIILVFFGFKNHFNKSIPGDVQAQILSEPIGGSHWIRCPKGVWPAATVGWQSVKVSTSGQLDLGAQRLRILTGVPWLDWQPEMPGLPSWSQRQSPKISYFPEEAIFVPFDKINWHFKYIQFWCRNFSVLLPLRILDRGDGFVWNQLKNLGCE